VYPRLIRIVHTLLSVVVIVSACSGTGLPLLSKTTSGSNRAASTCPPLASVVFEGTRCCGSEMPMLTTPVVPPPPVAPPPLHAARLMARVVARTVASAARPVRLRTCMEPPCLGRGTTGGEVVERMPGQGRSNPAGQPNRDWLFAHK